MTGLWTGEMMTTAAYLSAGRPPRGSCHSMASPPRQSAAATDTEDEAEAPPLRSSSCCGCERSFMCPDGVENIFMRFAKISKIL